MNIGVDIRHLAQRQRSGIGFYTLHTLRACARLAPDITFVAFGSGSEQTRQHLPIFEEPNIKMVYVPIPNRLLHLKLLAGTQLEDLLPTQIDAWWFPNSGIIRTRLPYTITAHDVSMKLFPNFFTAKDRLWDRLTKPEVLYKNASKILAVSERTKCDLTLLFDVPEERIHVSPLAAISQLSPRTEPADGTTLRTYGIKKPYFLTLSTLEPRKNIESVVDAYSAWRPTKTNAPDLVIAGQCGWKYKAIFQFIENSPAKEHIKYIDYISEHHKPTLLRHAHTLLFPSFYEGFGIPVVEAMKSGTPVITSFTGSLPEVGSDAVIYVDPWNVTDLEQAMELVQSESLRKRLSEAGLKRAESFSWERTAEKTLKALREALGVRN